MWGGSEGGFPHFILTSLFYSPLLNLEDTTGKAGWTTEVAFRDSGSHDHGASIAHKRMISQREHQSLWAQQWSLASADWSDLRQPLETFPLEGFLSF